MKPSCYLTVILAFALPVSGCKSDGPIAPGGNNMPPGWVSTVGIVSVVPGESAVTVYWGEAIDYQDPPVQYLVYKDVDDNPFDQTPAVRDSNEPYTFENLAVGTEYWFGVRVRDRAKPPHVDDNNKVVSGRTADHGWVRTWGGSDVDVGNSVAVDGFGNVYITGWFGGTADFNPAAAGVDNHTSNGPLDIFLSKFDSSGNFQWARTWGGSDNDYGYGVAVDGFGNVYMTGDYYGTADFDPGSGVDIHVSDIYEKDIFLSKFDSSGNYQWARTWGGDYIDDGYRVAVDESGNAYVTGKFRGTVDFDPAAAEVDSHESNGRYDIFLSKFDSSGNYQWARTWGGSDMDESISVALDGSGNAYMTGSYKGTVDFDPGVGVDNHATNGYRDIFLSKIDSSGNFIWARTWGGSDKDSGVDVDLDGSGNAYVTGWFSYTVDFDPGSGIDNHTSNGFWNIFLSKFDPSGNFKWARTWGGSKGDTGFGVAVDGSGSSYVTGYFEGTVDFNPGSGVYSHSANGNDDAFLSRFDTNGNFIWARTWGGMDEDSGNAIASDSLGNAYVVGDFYNSAVDFNPGPGVDEQTSNGSYDAFLIKFLPDGYW